MGVQPDVRDPLVHAVVAVRGARQDTLLVHEPRLRVLLAKDAASCTVCLC